MAKIYSQKMPVVFSYSGSLAANASTSGSLLCDGYAKLVGGMWSSCTLQTGSGVHVEFAFDVGDSGSYPVFDYTSASDPLAASVATACTTDVVGQAARVTVRMGAETSPSVHAWFALLPTS